MWSPILFVTGNDKIGVSGLRIELVKVQNVELQLFALILAGVNCRRKCFDFRWKSERDSQRPTRIFFISVRDFRTIRPTLTVGFILLSFVQKWSCTALLSCPILWVHHVILLSSYL